MARLGGVKLAFCVYTGYLRATCALPRSHLPTPGSGMRVPGDSCAIDDFLNDFYRTRAHGLQRPRTTSPSVTNMTVWVYSRYASVFFFLFRSARALSRHGPWTARSTFAPIEWSMIVPGAGVGRTKKPKVVRHPPTMWRGGTTISASFGIRHRAVATTQHAALAPHSSCATCASWWSRVPVRPIGEKRGPQPDSV